MKVTDEFNSGVVCNLVLNSQSESYSGCVVDSVENGCFDHRVGGLTEMFIRSIVVSSFK